MEVVLMQDVRKLGKQGKVVKVKPGYARNYLVPRGLAVYATPEQLRSIEEIARQQSRKIARLKADAQALKQKVEAFTAHFSLNVGDEDKPFGSVTVNDIHEKLTQAGLEIDKHAIQLDQPIKTLGKTSVAIRIHPEVAAKLEVVVVKA